MDVWKNPQQRQWLFGPQRDAATTSKVAKQLMFFGSIFCYMAFSVIDRKMDADREKFQKEMLESHRTPDALPYLDAVTDRFNDKVFALRRQQLGLPEQPPTLLEIRDPEDRPLVPEKTTKAYKLPW